MARVIALHGFLGLPSDWNDFADSAIDIMQILSPSPQNSLWKWAEAFHHSQSPNQPSILMGYSMGARLAMHALLHHPERWRGAILISGNPGLTSAKQKAKRLQQDLQWAHRFESEPWDQLIDSWNRQSTFANMPYYLRRKEEDYDRASLADTLRYWSLGKQEPLLSRLAQLPIPILWIAGEKDLTSSTLAHTLSFAHVQSRIWIAPNSGHRIPWEAPGAFKEQVQQFLRRIE